MKTQTFLISAIIIGLAFIGWVGYKVNSIIQANKQGATSETQSHAAIPNGKTYLDPIFGYSIQYPNDWKLVTGTSYQIQFRPPDKAETFDAPVGDVIYGYQGDVWIDIFENPDNTPVDTFIRDQVREDLDTEPVRVGNQTLQFYRNFCPFRTYGAPRFALWDYPFCDGSVVVAQDGYVIAVQFGLIDSKNTRSTYDAMLATLTLPEDPTANWEILENERYGYRLKHPSPWKMHRHPDVNYGVVVDNPEDWSGGFTVYNGGGAQQPMTGGGLKDEHGVSTLSPETIDGVTFDITKFTYWQHGGAIDPVPGSPGPGFYHSLLELNYVPQAGSSLPSTWAGPSWISLYPDSLHEELTVPRMILKTFEFDESLITNAQAPTCTVMTTQAKFEQADAVVTGRVLESIPAQTKILIQNWYKVPPDALKARPDLMYVIPSFGLNKPNDMHLQQNTSYLFYAIDENREPARYSVDQCSGTRVYDGSLTAEEMGVLIPR